MIKMSKIFYFTSAQDKDSFKSSLPLWKVSPNLSNQNFHNKLIRAISLNHDVDVISVRPINKNYAHRVLSASNKKEGRINWRYIKVSSSRIDKKLFLFPRIKGSVDYVGKDDVVITDTLNLSILKSAIKFAKGKKLKILGVCTDNPMNISFTSKEYQNKLLKLGQSLDGYICLTEPLADLYTCHNAPYIVIDGITEGNDLQPINNEDKPYIFFGGSLMHKYGIHNLINAFEQLNREDINLLICGHHEESNFKEFISKFQNIKYLGALDYDQVNNLEKCALIAVNPRPNMDEIDNYSFPSKTLEYLSNGVLTITVRNPILEKNYKDCIIWAESGSIEDLKNALEKALSLKEENISKIKDAAKSVIESRTSFEYIAKKVDTLL